MAEKSLASDPVLSGVAAIARYVYNDDSPYFQRRVRHLIREGVIPVRTVARRKESRASWLDRVWAEPDSNGAEK